MWAGCGVRLRAVEGPDQTRIESKRGLMQVAEDVVARVTWVRHVPLGSKDEFTGFHIEVHNERPAAISLPVESMALEVVRDGETVLKRPVYRPRAVLQPRQAPEPRPIETQPSGARAGIESGDAGPARARLVRHYRGSYRGYRYGGSHYRHYYSRPHHYYYYRPYYSTYYGHYFYGGYGPYTYDSAYYDWRRANAFAAQLLASQVVESGFAVSGYVVFAHRLEDEESVVLYVPIPLHPPAPGTQPAPPPPAEKLIELRFEFQAD